MKTKNISLLLLTATILSLFLIGFVSAATCIPWHDPSKDAWRWGSSRCINTDMDTGASCAYGTFNCDGYGDCTDVNDGGAYCQSCGCSGAGVGYVDGLTNCAITGWARDNFFTPFKSTVHLYFDGPAGVGYGLNIGLADAPREPAVGTHGFNTVRSSIVGLGGTPGSTHTVYGYSWDVFGNRYDLSNFPKTITIPVETCDGTDEDCDGTADNGLKVNGGWSDWNCGEWFPTYGSGCYQYYRKDCIRTCTNPSPACGGADCVGPSTSSETKDGGYLKQKTEVMEVLVL